MTNAHNKQVVLIILDGWGHRDEINANPIKTAHTPCFDKLWTEYPHTTIAASGEAVGLPQGQIGNSEIGHMTLGTGHVFQTDLHTIDTACTTGTLSKNTTLIDFLETIRQQNGTLHLVGLLSEGGVHSHQNHLFALIKIAATRKLKQVALHLYTDGRDTKQDASVESFRTLRKLLAEVSMPTEIVSLAGRYFGMDRNNNYERTRAAAAVLTGIVAPTYQTPEEWIRRAHTQGISDEFITPARFTDVPLNATDGILLWNFRPDRMRQITTELLQRQKIQKFKMITMTCYSDEYPIEAIFSKDTAKSSLPKTLADQGLTQTHIAESEKYPHVTYFFNGGKEMKHQNEEWICIESRRDILTHDLAPDMRVHEIGETTCDAIRRGQNFVLINIANPDMVGHTANELAIKKAIEETDKVLEKIVTETQKQNGVVIVTADHGNAETNKHPDGTPHTAHTTNRVPCIITDKSHQLREDGSLADIAPTIYEILEIKNPPESDGLSLFLE